MLDYFIENFPIFDIRKEDDSGLNSLIKMNYNGYCVTIQYADLGSTIVWNPYLEVSSYSEVGIINKYGSYNREDVKEYIYEEFKKSDYYDSYIKDLRVKKLERII